MDHPTAAGPVEQVVGRARAGLPFGKVPVPHGCRVPPTAPGSTRGFQQDTQVGADAQSALAGSSWSILSEAPALTQRLVSTFEIVRELHAGAQPASFLGLCPGPDFVFQGLVGRWEDMGWW